MQNMQNMQNINDIKLVKIAADETQQLTIHSENSTRDEYNLSMIQTSKEIEFKVKSLNAKLSKFDIKENMLDAIIIGTHVEMKNLKENEFTKRGQKQAILIKQLEALSVLHDTIMKYEDMIQKYHRITMDIQNNKLNAYIKLENLKKEEEKSDNSLSEVLMNLQEMLAKNNSAGLPDLTLIAEIEEELKDNNYK